MVFVTLSPVVCPCPITVFAFAKSMTANTSAKDINKLADFDFCGKGAIPVITVRTPGLHGQDLSFVISLLLLGWANFPGVGRVGCGSARWPSRYILATTPISLAEKTSRLTQGEKSSDYVILRILARTAEQPFPLKYFVFVCWHRLRSIEP